MKIITLLFILLFAATGCNSNGSGGDNTKAPIKDLGISIVSNKSINSYGPSICTQYTEQQCFFNGGQIMKFSDGSIFITGSFETTYLSSDGEDIDTDQNMASLWIPFTSNTEGYISLSSNVARGTAGLQKLFLAYNEEELTLVYDVDTDGVVESADEVVTTLSLSNW